MKIRKIIENDLPALVALARETFVAAFVEQNNPDDFDAYVESAFTLDAFKKEFYTEGSVFYVVENQELLIGYFKLNHNRIPHDALNAIADFELCKTLKMTELERIYLATEMHGKGLAQEMMTAAFDLATAEKSVFLWLGVWEMNGKAIKFYQKSGFSKFAEHIFSIGNDPQTDWLMWKKLP